MGRGHGWRQRKIQLAWEGSTMRSGLAGLNRRCHTRQRSRTTGKGNNGQKFRPPYQTTLQNDKRHINRLQHPEIASSRPLTKPPPGRGRPPRHHASHATHKATRPHIGKPNERANGNGPWRVFSRHQRNIQPPPTKREQHNPHLDSVLAEIAPDTVCWS